MMIFKHVHYRSIAKTIGLSFLLPMSLLANMLLMSTSAYAKDAELWPYWQKSNADNSASIDHSPWDSLLKKYIRQDGDLNRFSYAKVTNEDKTALKSYIKSLESVNITNHNRLEQRAYWANLYNAVTIDVVLDNYPVDSIKDISSGLFSSGPWGENLVTVEGKAMSLDDIEHRVLRPIWNTPLTHYIVNCASVGCPNLHNAAFTASNIKSLQAKLAKDYINSRRGVSVDDAI